MEKHESCILTNMCMVSDGNGNVLVQDRTSASWRGMTFPGGHVENGETFAESVIREVEEETGLRIEAPRLCGVKQFLTRDGNRYIVFLYKTERFSGTLRSSDEGAVSWIPLADFDRYTWVPDFEGLLRVFLNDDVSEVCYTREDSTLVQRFF